MRVLSLKWDRRHHAYIHRPYHRRQHGVDIRGRVHSCFPGYHSSAVVAGLPNANTNSFIFCWILFNISKYIAIGSVAVATPTTSTNYVGSALAPRTVQYCSGTSDIPDDGEKWRHMVEGRDCSSMAAAAAPTYTSDHRLRVAKQSSGMIRWAHDRRETTE